MVLRILEIIGKILLLFAFFVILILGFGVLLIGVFHIKEMELYLQTIIFISATLLMYFLFERKRGWSLGLKQQDGVLQFWKGCGLGIVLISAVFLLILLTGNLKVLQVEGPISFANSITQTLMLFILVALSEEILDRGYVQGLIKYRFSTKAAWITTSIFFALLHGANPGVWDEVLPMLNLFLAGLFLAIYRDQTGGLWAPIGFHFTWNWFQGAVFGFAVSGTEVQSLLKIESSPYELLSGGEFGAEGSIFATIVLLVPIVMMLYKRKNVTEMKGS